MGAWIEILNTLCQSFLHQRRTPRWVRGLKLLIAGFMAIENIPSHPTMGAWIEIIGLFAFSSSKISRTPRWVRGLKFSPICNPFVESMSHPTMGAWIEMDNEL